MDLITLEALQTFPKQLAAHYAAIPTGFKHWAPPSWEGIPSEHFTAIEQICHVRDIEIDGYQIRFARTVSEANPTLPGLDSEGLAKARSYETADAAKVLEAFAEARLATLAFLVSRPPEELKRPAFFEGYGHTSLRGLVHYLCSHDQQHLAGMQWLLGQITDLVLREHK
ncbi:MAG TPA: DinB family protein [Myxococcales bacterium]|nr:DinB family protein [Myxococcales bacterium]